MFDFTTEDRHWIEQENQWRFLFIEKENAFAFYLGNGCTVELVWNLMSVQLNGCTSERVCSLHFNFPTRFKDFILFHVVYCESINRECRKEKTYTRVSVWCKTKTKAVGSTRLAYTGLLGGLEHLKIEKRLIDERFAHEIYYESIK
jgi:hypothetical protein